MKKTLIILTLFATVVNSYGQENENICPQNAYYLLESFTDSTQIGKKGHNQVFIAKYANDSMSDCFVRLFFYSKGSYNKVWKTDWRFCNEFIFSGCAMGLLPEVADFNNDGYNDFTYYSVEAARGGNIAKKLFIYNPEQDEFMHIKNSEDYPNLTYNKELECITAFAYYGCTATVFLKLQGDSLRKFANIELCGDDKLTVTEYDEEGNETNVRRENNSEFDMWLPFKNYNPLEQ